STCAGAYGRAGRGLNVTGGVRLMPGHQCVQTDGFGLGLGVGRSGLGWTCSGAYGCAGRGLHVNGGVRLQPGLSGDLCTRTTGGCFKLVRARSLWRTAVREPPLLSLQPERILMRVSLVLASALIVGASVSMAAQAPRAAAAKAAKTFAP